MIHLGMIYNNQTYVLASSNFVQCSFCKFFYGKGQHSHPPLAIKIAFNKKLKGKSMCIPCYEKYKIDRNNDLFTELNTFDTNIETLLTNIDVKK